MISISCYLITILHPLFLLYIFVHLYSNVQFWYCVDVFYLIIFDQYGCLEEQQRSFHYQTWQYVSIFSPLIVDCMKKPIFSSTSNIILEFETNWEVPMFVWFWRLSFYFMHFMALKMNLQITRTNSHYTLLVTFVLGFFLLVHLFY